LHQPRFDLSDLILVVARRDEEALWAMEEGLKAPCRGAVLGEIEKLDLLGPSGDFFGLPEREGFEVTFRDLEIDPPNGRRIWFA
jgi:regulation of enolase protein 1 (concanavalin A-like superfamily)